MVNSPPACATPTAETSGTSNSANSPRPTAPLRHKCKANRSRSFAGFNSETSTFCSLSVDTDLPAADVAAGHFLDEKFPRHIDEESLPLAAAELQRRSQTSRSPSSCTASTAADCKVRPRSTWPSATFGRHCRANAPSSPRVVWIVSPARSIS